MELEKMSAELRPRSEWEAIDLGLALTREHLGGIAKAWAVTVLPLICLILAGSFFFTVAWTLTLVWWLKPLFERVVLHYLSRALFGEKPTGREVVRAFPGIVASCWPLVAIGFGLTLSGWWLSKDSGEAVFITLWFFAGLGLLFYRSLPNRAFTLPVKVLEGLKGKNYSRRLTVLGRRGGAAVWLMALVGVMETALIFSLFLQLMPMIPMDRLWDLQGMYYSIMAGETDFMPEGMWWLLAALYVIAMSVSTWFFVGGGFGLYLNARTWIEGWDVELRFRKLGRRLGGGTTALGLVLSLGLLFSTPVHAQAEAELQAEAGEVVGPDEGTTMEEILASPDFKQHKKTIRVPVPKSGSSGSAPPLPSGFASFVGVLGQLIFWIVLTLLVVGLVWLIYQNRHLFERESGPEKSRKAVVTTMMGLNLSPESLPEDVLAAARAAWEANDHHGAVSLLYRGAISWLVERDLARIEESSTEADCLRAVEKSVQNPVSGYFRKLTGVWVALAYGRREPDGMAMEEIWVGWPFQKGK